MKITKILAAISMVFPFCLPAQTVTVTSPNGGESWALNTPHNITWNFQNAGNIKVDIILRDSGGKVGVIESQVALAAGTWHWALAGKLKDGTMVPPKGDYVVRIRNADSTVIDDGNDPFSLAGASPPASITVTSPKLNDKWNRTKTYAVTWTKSGTMPNAVKISLMDKNSASVVREIVDGAVNSGSYSWTVPADAAFDDYRVRVLVKTTDVKDDSDTFTIAIPRMPHDTALVKSTSLHVTRALEEAYPGCDKYVEYPQITNWGNPHEHSEVAYMEKFASRPKGLPQGEASGSYAHVGYDYFSFPGYHVPVWITFCYRSRLWVNTVRFQNVERNGRRLVAAKLYLRQFHSLIAGDNSASCAVGLAVFLAPWTDFWDFRITHQGTGGLNAGSTDYSVDITEVVRKWIDETWPDCGLLLTSREVDWGQQAKTCYSSFHVSMTLWFKKE